MKRIFINRFFGATFIFIIIQQMIVASSTFWIAQLGNVIAEGKAFQTPLFYFISSLVVVYLPGILSLIYLERGKFESFFRYVNQFIKIHSNKGSERNTKELKGTCFPYLTSEGLNIIEEICRFFYDAISMVLNVFLNVLVIAFVLEKGFLLAYGVSLLLAIISLKFNSEKITQNSDQAQKARVRLKDNLLLGWDNILIKNQYNFTLWRGEFDERLNQARQTAVKTQQLSQLSATLTMLVTMIPVLGLIIYLFFREHAHLTYLAILVSTLPRQIQVLQCTHTIVSYATEWSALKARLQSLATSLQGWDEPNLKNRIQWDSIKLMSDGVQKKVKKFEDIEEVTHQFQPGRFTIRGPNGCGKSTLLLGIHQAQSLQSFYLPPHSELSFKHDQYQVSSTGEKTKRNIEEIKNLKVCSIILFDEWDANLDSAAIQEISALLDEIAQTKCLIEVRHR